MSSYNLRHTPTHVHGDLLWRCKDWWKQECNIILTVRNPVLDDSSSMYSKRGESINKRKHRKMN